MDETKFYATNMILFRKRFGVNVIQQIRHCTRRVTAYIKSMTTSKIFFIIIVQFIHKLCFII